VVAELVQEPDQHLVEHDIVEQLHGGRRDQRIGTPPGVRAAALDELGDPRAAEGANRRVDGKGASAP
jgi:hypothetical protein